MPDTAAPSTHKTAPMVAYFTTLAGLGLVGALLGPALQGLASHTNSRLDQVSILFTTRMLGFLLGSLLGGGLYRGRLRPHLVMALTLVTLAAVLFLAPLQHFLWLLAALLFIQGLGEGSLDVGSNALTVRVQGQKAAPYLNGLHFAYSFGAFVAPLIIARALQLTADVHGAYWAAAALLAPIAVYCFFLPNPQPAATRADGAASAPAGGKSLLIALGAGLFFLAIGVQLSYGGWASSYAVAVGLGDAVTGSYLTSVFWGLIMLGRLVSVLLSTRLRPRWMLAGSLAGSLLAVALILLFPRSPGVLWVGVALAGLTIAPVMAGVINLIDEYTPATSGVVAWLYVGLGLGGMSFPWLVGQFFERTGPRVLPLILLAGLLAASALLAGMWLYSRRLPSRTPQG